MNVQADTTLDCIGLACPMPIVKTKKMMAELADGQVLEIQATDKGSLADLQAWSQKAGHQYVGTIMDGGVLKHYVRKTPSEEIKPETRYPHTAGNEELAGRLASGDELTVLDVREAAEYAFRHVKGAISIPLGQLESLHHTLRPDSELYVICRTGTRSDMACQWLADHGYSRVKNVVPGMSDWTGETESEVEGETP
ncbi:sulfurtransferase TusA family protein [Paenibacillus sp. NPDC057967]|uniref:sulfurtransferase TusA family protein n=1 Tax=Paenibacillus sp. NPDC057967 TaxID=3346293 RepID=UPI0036DB5F32